MAQLSCCPSLSVSPLPKERLYVYEYQWTHWIYLLEGAFRKGKSFLLNILLHHLQAGGKGEVILFITLSFKLFSATGLAWGWNQMIPNNWGQRGGHTGYHFAQKKENISQLLCVAGLINFNPGSSSLVCSTHTWNRWANCCSAPHGHTGLQQLYLVEFQFHFHRVLSTGRRQWRQRAPCLALPC